MSAPDGPIRMGLVGCGRLAERGYVPAIAASPRAALVAVADPDEARAAEVAVGAARVGGGASPAVFPDALALVAGAEVDAVIVASPARAHVADAEACAAAGVAALVEKPPAPTADGAAALARLEPAPWVGFNRRFDLGIRRVRAAVPATRDVTVRVRIAYRRASWQAHEVDDDALLDLGPHAVDLAGWLTASPVREVRAGDVTRERAQGTLTTDRATVTFDLRCDRPWREVIEVRERGGPVLARWEVGGPIGAVRGRVRRGPHPLVASLANQVDALVRVLHGEDRGALADVHDAHAVMLAIDAVRTSAAADGAAVTVA